MKSEEEIRSFLVERVSQITDVPRDSIATSTPFYRLNIDSMMLVAVADELENFLEHPVKAEVMFQAKNIDQLVSLLTQEFGK